ncbi:endonuclease III [Candidatus Parvarchaeota archaeon]|nr:endonuclease III [Candidatus Parvarchaeota archaeon]
MASKKISRAPRLVSRATALLMQGILKNEYPEATCSLDFGNPLQLLVSTILSAQCTDARVNKVTPALFARYASARDFANAKITELENLIRSTGFYHNKAKNIKEACRVICIEFGGKVPGSMEDLLKLPGVARKTANIVLYNAHGKNEGIAIDTHNIRLSQRLGWTKNRRQNGIERDLMATFPKEEWGLVSNLLVFHGRAKCTAKNPKCPSCPLGKICPSAKQFS